MRLAARLWLVGMGTCAFAACSGDAMDAPHAGMGTGAAGHAGMHTSRHDDEDAGLRDAGVHDAAVARVCSVDGFCWEQPTPQGETLRAVWAAGPSDVWAVGDGGVVLHANAAGFAAEHVAMKQDLLAIHGSGARDVWAVGKGGMVLHWDGEVFSTQDLSDLFDASGGAKTAALYGVFAAAPDAVWAVGHSGVSAVILHYDGQHWTNQSLGLGTDQALRAVWGVSAARVWAVGDMGVIRSFDGMQWNTDKSPTGSALVSVHALAAHDVWAVGANAAALHWNGTAWSSASMGLSGALRSVRVDIAAAPPVLSDGGMAGVPAPAPAMDAGADAGLEAPKGPWSVWAFGEKGHVFRYNGTVWAGLPSGSDFGFNAAARVAEHTLLAVGEHGQVTRFAGDARQSLSLGSRHNHLALWGNGDTLWAVGDDIAKRDTTGWHDVMRPNARSLYGVWGDTTGAWAVGTSGSVVRIQPDGTPHAVAVAAAGETWLHAVWGAGNSVWVVGDAGFAMTSAASSFIKVATPVKSNLLDVWGTADDAFWAVGDGGTVLCWDGMAWLKVPTGPMGGVAENLRAVWGSAKDDVWVVGTAGTILHWTGQRFESQSQKASYSLNDVWGRSKDEVYAVGSGGVALRYDGTQWTELQTGTRSSLQSVFGDGSGRIFAAGLEGVVLVHEPAPAP